VPGERLQLLISVVEELSELQAVKFEDIDLILEGYSSFLKYRTKEMASMQVQDHEIYQSWFKVRGRDAFLVHKH